MAKILAVILPPQSLPPLAAWWLKNQEAIVAGIVSSLIVVALQVFVGVSIKLIYDALRGQRSLRRLLQFKEPKRIYVISGNIEVLAKETFEGMVLLAAQDAEAAVTIKNTLERLYPKAQVVQVFCSNMADEIFQHDVVCVGGPVNNSATRLLLGELTAADADTPAFDGMEIVNGADRYRCIRDDVDSRVNADHGLLLVDDNPFNPTSRCVIVAGCDTNGVLAAAAYLTLGPKRRRLFKQIAADLSLRFWTIRKGQLRRLALVVRTRAVGTLSGAPSGVALQTRHRRGG